MLKNLKMQNIDENQEILRNLFKIVKSQSIAGSALGVGTGLKLVVAKRNSFTLHITLLH
jgi:hypothetical protein